jgi:hypothetical protein
VKGRIMATRKLFGFSIWRTGWIFCF